MWAKVLGGATWILLAIILALGAGMYIQTQRLSKATRTAQDAQTQVESYRGSLERSQALVEALKASDENRTAVAEHHKERAAARSTKHEEESHEVETELQSAPDWASQRIPDGVRGTLQGVHPGVPSGS